MTWIALAFLGCWIAFKLIDRFIAAIQMYLFGAAWDETGPDRSGVSESPRKIEWK